MTYIEEIMKKCRKEKTPAPGQYKLGKSLKEMDEERKKNRYTKVKQQDRMTYLDAVQYEAAQIPGVGKYNTKVRVIMKDNTAKIESYSERRKPRGLEEKACITK
jgi:hypothetical protein